MKHLEVIQLFYLEIIQRLYLELPPVSDKPLYHSVSDNATSLMGYMGYMKFQDVVILFVNECVASGDDIEFCDLLVRLRNGESTISDWEIWCSRNVHHHDITNSLNTTVRLAYTNEVVAKHNYEMLRN